MIPVKDTAAVEESNITGEKIALGVSADISHIMSVLTRLYSDEATAVIREYSCNAHDAHVEAGIARPIEVTTPTPFAPFLTIRDYGWGLSLDGLRRVYSQYGESTKRDSNAVTGMLGLGSKSGLAYAPTFNITSICDGVKVLAQMKRNVEGGGEITIIDVRDAMPEDESGVEIKIPAKDSWSIQRKAEAFFRFWPAGSVMVDGEFPDTLSGITVTDNIMVCSGIGQDYIVMGNVPYPVESNRLSTTLPIGKNVVAVVPIGSVKPAPSREALIYNEQTNVAIGRIEQEMKDALAAATVEAVRTAKTHAEALTAANEWREVVNRDYVWRGETVPQSFKEQHYVWKPYRGRYATSSDSTFYCGKTDSITKMQGMVLIHNFVDKDGNPYAEMSTTHRAKIRAYYEYALNESLPSTIVVSNDKIGEKWLDGIVSRVDYGADILPFRKPIDPNKVRATMGKQPIEVFDPAAGGWVDSDDDTKWEGPYILTTPAHRDTFPTMCIRAALPDYTLVRLGKGRWDKFERLFGEDTEVVREYDFWTIFEARKQGVIDAMTEADRIVMHGHVDRGFATALGAHLDELENDEVREYLTTLRDAVKTEAYGMWNAFFELSRMSWERSFNRPPVPTITLDWREGYPLVNHIGRPSQCAADVVHYMNNIDSNKEGK